MATLDQYETEARCIYSGSTSSRVFWGNAWQNRATTSPGSSASINRYVIGNKIRGLNTDYRQSLWLYSDMLYYFSGSYAKGNVRHNILFSDETYFDSYPANPLEIYMVGLSASGITGAHADASLLSGSSEFNISAVPVNQSIKIYIGATPPGTYGGGLTLPVLQFSTQYPFESTYKNLERFFRAGYDQSITVKSNYDSNGTFGHYTASNIGTLGFTTSTATQLVSYVLSDATMSMTDQPEKGHSTSDKLKETNKTRTPYSVFSKAFFGIGNGLFKSATGGNINTREPLLRNSPNFFDQSGSAGVSFAPILRGFKYGLYHCLPQQSKHIYRLGYYGQLRDMLEQPAYSKMKLADGQASYFVPLEVSFITSSNIYQYVTDYKNATTASWYNPTDSGRFDSQYRSGQPFSDSTGIPSILTGES